MVSNKFLIYAIIACFFLLSGFESWSQKSSCTNTLDSASVVALVKKKGLLFQPEKGLGKDKDIPPVYLPIARFNETNCSWEVSSKKYTTTRRGNCKHTNGCTIVTTQTVFIDAQKGKIISKKKDKQRVPNYE